MRQATGIHRSQQLEMMLDEGILVQTCNPGKGDFKKEPHSLGILGRLKELVNNPLASQAAAAAAAMGSIASSQAFGNALSSLQGVTGQLVTNAQGQIIGTIPLMPNPGPSSQATSGTQGLQVQPITPQLLTNAQGQIIATVIGNQILPVINTQGITLSPIKPGQQWRHTSFLSATTVSTPDEEGQALLEHHSQSQLVFQLLVSQEEPLLRRKSSRLAYTFSIVSER
ncbi:POU domain, class 6, transcription factor 2 [Microtus ochrogaster]|uniref:POU domain, class 6, transcription factor 2 n=1 Tax=Microtus ochrogaster TaxID=79684 RepID=A0A8J6G673_MICOH|nr:POU domain, class 6, transcription factor 2 [Microtus ochrogaster]